MIKRNYYYRAQSATDVWTLIGVIEVKSWRADPWGTIIKIKEMAANKKLCNIDDIDVTVFNRV